MLAEEEEMEEEAVRDAEQATLALSSLSVAQKMANTNSFANRVRSIQMNLCAGALGLENLHDVALCSFADSIALASVYGVLVGPHFDMAVLEAQTFAKQLMQVGEVLSLDEIACIRMFCTSKPTYQCISAALQVRIYIVMYYVLCIHIHIYLYILIFYAQEISARALTHYHR